jgi:hypothetical protein
VVAVLLDGAGLDPPRDDDAVGREPYDPGR